MTRTLHKVSEGSILSHIATQTKASRNIWYVCGTPLHELACHLCAGMIFVSAMQGRCNLQCDPAYVDFILGKYI